MLGSVFRMSWIGNLLVAVGLMAAGVLAFSLLEQQATQGLVSGTQPASEPIEPELVLGIFSLLASLFLLLGMIKLVLRLLGFGRRRGSAAEGDAGAGRERPGFMRSGLFRTYTFLFFVGAFLSGIVTGRTAEHSVEAFLPLYLFGLVWMYLFYRVRLLTRKSKDAPSPANSSSMPSESDRSELASARTAAQPHHASPWGGSADPAAEGASKRTKRHTRPEIATPFSDAVLHKARRDPFEALRRRYRLKGFRHD